MGDDQDRRSYSGGYVTGRPQPRPADLEIMQTAPLTPGSKGPAERNVSPSGQPHSILPEPITPAESLAPAFDGLARLAARGSTGAPPLAAPLNSAFPPRPTTLDETQLEPVLLEELALKHIVSAGVLTAAEVAERLRLALAGIVEETVSALRRDGLVEYSKTGGGALAGAGMRLRPTERGIQIERLAREQSGYIGPAPVSLKAFLHVQRQQATASRNIARSDVWRKLSHLVLSDATIDRIGAGLESGGPILLFGESGNGKTSIASALAHMFRVGVLIPHAVFVDGHIVRIFDPSVHKPLAIDPNLSGAKLDDRWIYCQAPFVRAGADLCRQHLDLHFNERFHYYDCPIQLKATGGVLLIDDLGEQQDRVEDLLYRCLEPMANGIDHLTTMTGSNVPVPFTPLPVVATSRPPAELLSEALLRRFPCKIEIASPNEEQYRELLRRACQDAGIEYDDNGMEYVVARCYGDGGRVPRSCHPAQLVRLIGAAARYFRVAPQLVPQLIDVAADMYLSK